MLKNVQKLLKSNMHFSISLGHLIHFLEFGEGEYEKNIYDVAPISKITFRFSIVS